MSDKTTYHASQEQPQVTWTRVPKGWRIDTVTDPDGGIHYALMRDPDSQGIGNPPALRLIEGELSDGD